MKQRLIIFITTLALLLSFAVPAYAGAADAVIFAEAGTLSENVPDNEVELDDAAPPEVIAPAPDGEDIAPAPDGEDIAPAPDAEDTATTGETATETTKSKSTVKGILISLVIGLIVAAIVISSIKSKYKPVRKNRAAANYLVNGSFALTNSYENFVRTETTQRELHQNNNNN